MNCRKWSIDMMAWMVAASSLLLAPARASERRHDATAVAPYACHVASRFVGQDIAVERRFTPDGQEVMPLTRPTGGTEATAADAVRAQLSAYIETLRADLPGNCPPPGADGEYRLHRFACDPVLRVGQDVYSLENSRAHWGRNDPAFRMQLYWTLEPGHDFASQGLPPHNERPPFLFVDRPGDWPQRNFGVEGARGRIDWTYREAFEVRVGGRVFRNWTTSNVMVSVPWTVWPDLLAEEGEIVITVYDRDEGILAQRTFPHDLFAVTAARLAQLQARLRDDQADPVSRCPVGVGTEGWQTDIFVT